MGLYAIKLPDVGEGLAEAELVEWSVGVGDPVSEDMVIASVMTDKATVDIPSPVAGKVVSLGASVGDIIAIGAELIRLEVEGDGNVSPADPASAAVPADESVPPRSDPTTEIPAKVQTPRTASAADGQTNQQPKTETAGSTTRPAPPVARPAGEKPLAAPSVRRRAMDAGIDLRQVFGSGPAGRITHDDLDKFAAGEKRPVPGRSVADTSVTEVRIIGLRRKIAERMAMAKSKIPHITYVEEVDMTKLEELRQTLNESLTEQQTRLTILPFLMQAIVKAVHEQPNVNATFDDEAGIVHQYGGVHIGIATQTEQGLVVPVIRHAESADVWHCASELNRLAQASRDGSIGRDEMSGSTITITSLGKIGGLVTTPIINHPEVAIVGVNKMVMRPMWDGSQFVPRQMMNLSASFDHRIIDGWEAATFIQRLKTLMETPAMIFIQS